MPTRAIASVLKQAGLTIHEVDALATSWVTYPDFAGRVAEYMRFTFGHCPRILQYDHHECHAASAFHASGFAEAKVVTYDLSGDNISTAIWQGRGDTLTPLLRIERPNSLGIFYSIITQYLGFARDSDEYKVMGLAAYQPPSIDLSFLLQQDDPATYRLNLDYTRVATRAETGTATSASSRPRWRCGSGSRRAGAARSPTSTSRWPPPRRGAWRKWSSRC
jgi:carbamoyltransferase